MTFARSLRSLMPLACAAAFLAASGAAIAQTSSFPPAPTVELAVNPITNKVYVANPSSNSVTVLDVAHDTTISIPVGTQPEFIAVNPVTNRVYVDNTGDATVSVIDGATDTNLTPTALALGSVGPISVNPATNTIYVVRLSGTGRDEVTFLDGAGNTWYTIATGSFQPIAMAVNPLTDTIFVIHYATGDVRIISGAFNPNDTFPQTVSIGLWSQPTAIVANPVTNKVYAITADSRGPIAIIDGATQTATFPLPASGHGVGPKSIAVNPVTNKVYAAFTNEVIVIDGATNAYTYIPVDTGSTQVGLGVNYVTNKIYVSADDGTLTIIDGDTNATTIRSIPAGASAVGVNPLTNTTFVNGTNTTVVNGGSNDTAHAIPLTTTITPLAGNASGRNAALTMNASSGFSPNALPVRGVYYQLDSTAGAWSVAAGSGPYSASFTGLAPGPHTLYAFAADGQDAQLANGPQSVPLLGSVASYTFTVTLPVPSVSLASSANPSSYGQAVTFSASVSGSSATPTGTVSFLDGSTAISGCANVSLSNGTTSCTSSALAGGNHSITASYSGDSNYQTATSNALTQTVNAPKTAASVAVASSQNPSIVGASVTFTATLGGGSGPTGSVEFLDGASAISGCAAVAVANSSAACSTSALGVGSHSITASYSGDANFTAATSSVITQTVQPAPAPQAALSPASLAFGGESMGTTSPAQTITLTNTGTGTLSVSGITVSDSQFAQANDCASLAAGASCTITVTFTPVAAAGALNSTVPASATLSVASNSVSGTASATLSGAAEKSLVTHYYEAILRREPDAAGKTYWQDEAARVAGLGMNLNETWFAMAQSFFASAEYAAFNRDDAGFVEDLYETFFNRAADASGLSYWVSQIESSGLPRDDVLVSFMFSSEFQSFAQSIFGNTAARPEVDTVGDFYRGLLARLPDTDGFNYWVGQFRTAQCRGADGVYAAVQSISSQFAGSQEYAARARSNAYYVADLYNAFLRRGGDASGVQYWMQQLDSGAMTRDQVLLQFLASPEFSNRVQAIISAGCTS